MKRTKKVRELSIAQKIVITAQNMAEHIPGCDLLDNLIPYSADVWYEEDYYTPEKEHVDWASYVGDENNILDLIEDEEELTPDQLGQCLYYLFNEWLDESSVSEIMEVLHPLRVPEKRSMFLSFRFVADEEFRYLFDYDKYLKGIPAILAGRPFFIFFPSQRRSIFTIDKPIRKQARKSKLVMRNAPIFIKDLKIIVALSQIMARTCIKMIDGKYINFVTSYQQIGKELGVKNPYQESFCTSILSCLFRLRNCSVTIKSNITFRLSCILSKEKEIRFDHSGNLTIYFDNEYLNLFDYGFVDIIPEVLYRMSDKVAAMYVFLSAQKFFMLKGRYEIDLFKLHYFLNLGGLGKNHKEDATVKYEVKHLLKQSVEGFVIKKYEITDSNKVIIKGRGEVYK